MIIKGILAQSQKDSKRQHPLRPQSVHPAAADWQKIQEYLLKQSSIHPLHATK